ncbi:MAG: hypothetical protein AB8B61_09090 [Cyclobacteriaceae bacterium]
MTDMLTNSQKKFLSPTAQQFFKENVTTSVEKLLFSTKKNDLPVQEIAHQITCRNKFKNKLASWCSNPLIIFPKKVSVEQASSDSTANYKSTIVPKGKSFVDLSGGMGVDFAALSTVFEQGTYVERENELANLAQHNIPLLTDKPQTVVCDDALAYLKEKWLTNLIYIDPHRRSDTNAKLVSLADCQPNVLSIQDTLLKKTNQVLIKASPMLDIKKTLPELKHIKEVHIVSVKNECKELLFLQENGWAIEPFVIASNILSDSIEQIQFRYSEEKLLKAELSDMKQFVHIPNTAVTKAGAFKWLCKRFTVTKISKNSHVYTSNKPIPNFPGNTYSVSEIFSLKEAKKYLKDLKIGKASIIMRNVPMELSQLRKSLGIKGEGAFLLLATTDQYEKMVLARISLV